MNIRNSFVVSYLNIDGGITQTALHGIHMWAGEQHNHQIGVMDPVYRYNNRRIVITFVHFPHLSIPSG